MQDCLFGASGVYGANDYQSMIVYHHNAPAWNETLRLAVPIDKFYGSHIRLEYRHCSSESPQRRPGLDDAPRACVLNHVHS